MTPTPTQIAQWRKEFELAELAWLEDDLPSVKRDLLERKDDKYIHAMMRIKWNVCLATNLRAKAEQATEIAELKARLAEVMPLAKFGAMVAISYVNGDKFIPVHELDNLAKDYCVVDSAFVFTSDTKATISKLLKD